MATVELGYRDLITSGDGRCGGKLGLEVVPSASQAVDLDAVVSGRVQRSETAAALKDANQLFEQPMYPELWDVRSEMFSRPQEFDLTAAGYVSKES